LQPVRLLIMRILEQEWLQQPNIIMKEGGNFAPSLMLGDYYGNDKGADNF